MERSRKLCKCGCGEVTKGIYKQYHRRCEQHEIGKIVRPWVSKKHITIVEGILGKRLPRQAEIHHFDEDRENNGRGNLIVCEDRKYHMLLHKRTRALKECGHANWVKCRYCGQYDSQNRMKVSSTGRYHYHLKGLCQQRRSN